MRTGGQQVHQARRCCHHLLEIVQQYQPVQLTKHHLQVLKWWECARFLQSERLHQGGKHQVGILNGRERDEADAIREAPLYLGGDGQRQARLAHPAGAGQGEQTHLGTHEQGTGRGDLPLPPNERGERQGKGGSSFLNKLRGSCTFGQLPHGTGCRAASRLLLTRMPLQTILGRFRLLCGDRVLCGQGRSDGSEPVERHLLRRAQIDAVELASALAVGTPVPVPTLIARLLSADGKGSERTAHTEAGGRPQPGIPGRGSHPELIVLSVSLIDQRLTFDESSRPVLVAHAHHQTVPNTPVPEQYSIYSEPLPSGERTQRRRGLEGLCVHSLVSGWEASSPRPSSHILS